MLSFNDKILSGEFMIDDDEVDRVLKNLIEMGFVEEAGIDLESGQLTYKITEEGKKALPEMYQESMSMFNMIAFSLWNKNMINLTFNDEGLPMVALNKNSFDEEKIMLLPEAERFVLKQLIQSMPDISDII